MTAQSVLLAFVLVALAFAPTWRSLVLIWSDYYSSGLLIAPYTFWLVWARRNELVGDARPWRLMAGATLLASIGWLLGTIAMMQIVHQVMLPLVLAGWAMTILGKRAAPSVALITAVLLLAVPVLMVLVPLLQAATIAVNGVLLRVAGLQAVITGTFIRIPEGVFEVADGCAGAAFFVAALSLAAIYVTTFRPSRHAALAILASAVVLSLGANWLRVFGLILIGHWTAMQHPLVWDHGWFGWLIFAVVQVAWLWLAGLAERRWPSPPREVAPPVPLPVPHLVGAAPLWAVIATAAALAGPALALLVALRPRAAIPAAVPGLAAVPFAAPAASRGPTGWQPSGIDGQRHWQARIPVNGDTIQVDRVAFVDQRQGRELIGEHPHLGDSVVVLADEVIAPRSDASRFVRQAVVQSHSGRYLVWYWYRVAGIDTSLPLQAKLLEIVARIAGSAPSEFLSISGACDGTDCRATARSLFLTLAPD